MSQTIKLKSWWFFIIILVFLIFLKYLDETLFVIVWEEIDCLVFLILLRRASTIIGYFIKETTSSKQFIQMTLTYSLGWLQIFFKQLELRFFIFCFTFFSEFAGLIFFLFEITWIDKIDEHNDHKKHYNELPYKKPCKFESIHLFIICFSSLYFS